MTIKDIAELLASQGHKVKIRHRSDGGYIISQIDNIKYAGASGNIQARKITGATISHARAYQLERIRPPKIAPMKRKKAPLPEDLVRQMRKIQREWRKTHKDVGGTISIRGLRYQYETYGYETAKASLDKSFRYAQGYAYIENVQWLLQRIRQDSMKVEDSQALDELASLIETNIMTFKEDWINAIYQELYEFEKQGISADEFARRVRGIMGM